MPDIQKQVQLSVPQSRVWSALTDYRQFGEWFGVKVEGPFAVGEKASGFITYPGYEHLRWNVDVVSLEPESYFAFTWIPYAVDPEVDYSGETPTLVEFRLESNAAGTLLTVTESGFENVPAYRRDEALRMNDGGWAAQMGNIEKYLAR